jgi:peptidoglycan hydrolase CwlO-like protein
MELVFKFKEQVTRLTVETDDNLGLIQGLQEKIQEQNDYVNKLNVELNQSIKELEEDINKIKNSTYWLRDKKIWSK